MFNFLATIMKEFSIDSIMKFICVHPSKKYPSFEVLSHDQILILDKLRINWDHSEPFKCKTLRDMWCVLGNHGLRWNWSILILVQNRHLLIKTSRIRQTQSPQLIQGPRNHLLHLEFQKISFFTFFTFFVLLKSLCFTLIHG